MRYERPPGRLASEVTQDRDGTRTYLPEKGQMIVGPPGQWYVISEPVASFRDLYRRGKIREAVRARLDGQGVIRFTMHDNDLTATYFFDAETFMPREMRPSADGRPSYRYRILVYETLPARAADQLLTMPQRPGVKVKRRDVLNAPPADRRHPQCAPNP